MTTYIKLDSGKTYPEKVGYTQAHFMKDPDFNFMKSLKTDMVAASNGRIVEQTDTPRPEETEQFAYVEGTPELVGANWTQVWVQVARDAGEQTDFMKRAKILLMRQVQKKANQLATGTYSVGPGEFDLSGDGFSRVIMYGVVPGARSVPIGPDANGLERFFDASAAQVAGLVTDISNYLDAISANASALRDSIANSSTISELKSINIDAGWPTN